MDNNQFKVNRESFSIPKTLIDCSYEQSVEKDFVLPDYYPDIFRILKCTLTPTIISHSINGGKLSIEMNTVIKVLYLSDNDKRVNCLEQKLSFSKSLDISGECTNPSVTALPKCDYLNCRVVNKRRLDIRGAVTTAVKLISESEHQIVTDAFGCGIQLKKQLITYPAKRVTVMKRITVIDQLEISSSKPAVGTVIRSDMSVTSGEKKIIAGKLVVKGEAEISMLYSCVNAEGEDILESMKFSLPFSQIIDAEGIDESFDANPEISAGGCEIIPKGDDGRNLECELMILVNCNAVKYETCQAVADVYSTCFECETNPCEGQLFSIPKQINENAQAGCTLRYQDSDIGCIYDCFAKCENISAILDENEKCFMLSGNVSFTVMGRSAEKLPFIIESETPFEKEIPISEGCEDPKSVVFEPKVTVCGCSYHLADDNSVEVKAELSICGTLTEICARQLLSSINICTDKPKKRVDNYALKLCCCQSGEDIWEIAKRYSTSVTAIMEENELSDEKLNVQGMLLIPLMN